MRTVERRLEGRVPARTGPCGHCGRGLQRRLRSAAPPRIRRATRMRSSRRRMGRCTGRYRRRHGDRGLAQGKTGVLEAGLPGRQGWAACASIATRCWFFMLKGTRPEKYRDRQQIDVTASLNEVCTRPATASDPDAAGATARTWRTAARQLWAHRAARSCCRGQPAPAQNPRAWKLHFCAMKYARMRGLVIRKTRRAPARPRW